MNRLTLKSALRVNRGLLRLLEILCRTEVMLCFTMILPSEMAHSRLWALIAIGEKIALAEMRQTLGNVAVALGILAISVGFCRRAGVHSACPVCAGALRRS